MIAGNGLCVLLFCLRETGLTQAAIAFEDLAALPADRLRADGGKLIAAVRLAESTVRNPAPPQSVHTLAKLAFAWEGADDDMGMW